LSGTKRPAFSRNLRASHATVGRAGWDSSNAERLVAELQAEPMKASLIEAGFAKRDPEFIDLFIQNFTRIAGRMG
jgi:hypothetical protein